MKKIRTLSYATIVFMAMGFIACTQNEDTAVSSLIGQEINATFSVGDVQTRVNTLGVGSSWENGDKLKVKIFTDYNSGNTTVMSFNGDTNEWSRSGSFRWLDLLNKHSILAVYPSNYDPEKYELPLNQSSLEYLKSADLITGFWSGTPTYQLTVNMKHRMSRVIVYYETKDSNKNISSPQICSPCSGAGFSKSGNNWNMDTSNYSQAKFVDAYKTEMDRKKMFSAIIVPGSLDKNTVFLKFTLDGENYTVKLQNKTNFTEGKFYTYDLGTIG